MKVIWLPIGFCFDLNVDRHGRRDTGNTPEKRYRDNR